MSNFQTKTIEEVTETLIDYRGKTPPKTTEGIKLITAKVIKGGTILDDKHEYISEETYDKWMKRGYPQQWDVLITTEAPLGEVAQLRTPEKIALAQRVILLRGNPKIIDQQYYYQALKSDFVKGELNTRATGTTVLGIKQSELRKVLIPYYSLPTQNKIASIISAYDDLIENNTRRIKLLETMAQTLYQEWFVKFRFPGHEQVKMVESDLGLIPEGWELTTLGNACTVGDGAHARIKRQESGILYLTCKNFKGGDLDLSKVNYIAEKDYLKYFQENSKALTKPRLGDVLFSIIGTIGEPYLFQNNDKFGLSSSVAILRPDTNRLFSDYLYYWIRNNIFQDALFAIKGGVAQGYVSLGMIKSLPIYFPPISLQQQFNTHASQLLSLINALKEKNINLRKTRDLLLPKLISGQIDVENLDIDTGDIAA